MANGPNIFQMLLVSISRLTAHDQKSSTTLCSSRNSAKSSTFYTYITNLIVNGSTLWVVVVVQKIDPMAGDMLRVISPP